MGRLVVPLLIGLLGTAVLVSLGTWQLRRLAWKEGVLAEIDARISAPSVAVPDAPDPDRDRYLAVRTSGKIGPQEIRVLVSVKGVGPGYRIVSPITTDDGRRLLVDRGFVPDAQKDAPRPTTHADIAGNLVWPDETDSFTPENDLAGNLWFARDVARMAAALDTEPVLIVLRETSEKEPAVTPLPVDTDGIPNDHLQYAVTWFGLAAVWAMMSGYWMRRISRGTA